MIEHIYRCTHNQPMLAAYLSSCQHGTPFCYRLDKRETKVVHLLKCWRGYMIED